MGVVDVPPSGRWTWNDETQTLDFTCIGLSVEVKENRKKTSASILNKLASKGPKGHATPSVRKREALERVNAVKSVGDAIRDSVTLDDVKQVALSLVQENEALRKPLGFLSVIKSRELDAFLVSLLLYLSCYFEKKALEKSPKPLVVEQSLMEKREMEMMSAKVELALKQLAFCYSSLVLSLGLVQRQHMAPGRNRAYSTHKERQLHECLYSFFCNVAWITFERRDLKDIRAEIGRLLHSDTFNPALRTQLEILDAEQVLNSSKDGSQSEPRKHGRNPLDKRDLWQRLALSKILTLRSPVMVSLLPNPWEEAPHLFHKSCPQKQPLTKLCDTRAVMEELSQQLASVRFGILGKPLSQFNSTLMPLGTKSEDEEDDDDYDDRDDEELGIRIKSSKTSLLGRGSMTAATDKHSGPSRANTTFSRATTEAMSSDTE
ncbi:protein phosphatase 1 regulatory subunit 36 [Chanos chanos]|uniref:Protein phosphatase 1 regulatory subunit 36 n=1 Tax=Chanos chanos TaxID=29144 RepID=A0A6J2WJB2_CHACN|nr:protein phosphatase 1 regulatory subunit 36 [Chanos chanos]